MKAKTYTIKEQKNVQVLMADGAVQMCPFQQATPVQDKFRGIQLVPAACTSQCTHFNLKNVEGWNVDGKEWDQGLLDLTCGSTPVIDRIVTDHQDEPKPETKSGLILN